MQALNHETMWFLYIPAATVQLIKFCLMQALDAAFAHYDADVQKRSAKSGERPNGFM